MAGASSNTNAPKPRKRVEAETSSNTSTTLRRAKDGSAFARCEGCNKNVAVALISMHNCSLDAKIRVNLEAQVVETQMEAKKKPAEKKKSTSDEPKPKRLRKAANDGKKSSTTSNKPKRPLTAFFIFMNDFRQTLKEENNGTLAKDVAKLGGEKWKSMTEEEKKVYQEKAADLKADYEKMLESNDAEEEDEEKQSDDVDDAEEKQADDAEEKQDDEAEEKEVEKTEDDNKEAEGKEEEEEMLDDY